MKDLSGSACCYRFPARPLRADLVALAVSSSQARAMAASLLLHAALLWASASSSATAAEQCFSKVHPDLIVNASAAFLAKSTVLDAHASPSQQACLLDCCSQEEPSNNCNHDNKTTNYYYDIIIH
ncbi:hypothetical protein Z043_102153 [Scleropages formosus]|uniref:Uncharacterized protein n=1 Tax=Scleropages formosus TaxID=113540 RepID=A0A0N8K2P9_SCLFO|nr:hypothetical protein Z043_102153 [Scleropages formosus]